ncbi:hypothetical protein F8388_026428 [Cannabis sativa]|uniref:RNase H type-1 domain-containing protein n=1 Tax=Cannabis sativa TaxID=3483 RepID=A0A7J6ETM8_CANSA|nr:hypothetical protein F8388_026428 [Cannabis sativa]
MLVCDSLMSVVYLSLELEGDFVVNGDKAEEKVGGRAFRSFEGAILQNFLMDSGGVDLGFTGPYLTWKNARDHPHRVRKRLDRAIASPCWCTQYPRACVKNHPIVASDHAPLTLDIDLNERGLRYPFRFFEVWTSDPTCGQKLTKTKWALKEWNKNHFGFRDAKLKRLHNENELRSKGRKPNVMEISRMILKRAKEFSDVRSKDQTEVHDDSISVDRGLLIPIKWDGHFKVDASVKDGEVGTGVLQCGIGEDSATVLLQHFVGMTVLEAEFDAILQALQLALQEGYETILIEFDSTIAVKALGNKELPFMWGSYPVFYECLTLISKFKKCSVGFFPRCKNSVADGLARYARVFRCCKRTVLREVDLRVFRYDGKLPIVQTVLIEIPIETPTTGFKTATIHQDHANSADREGSILIRPRSRQSLPQLRIERPPPLTKTTNRENTNKDIFCNFVSVR